MSHTSCSEALPGFTPVGLMSQEPMQRWGSGQLLYWVVKTCVSNKRLCLLPASMKLWQANFLHPVTKVSDSSQFLTDSCISTFCFVTDSIFLCPSCHFWFLLLAFNKEVSFYLHFKSRIFYTTRAETSNKKTELVFDWIQACPMAVDSASVTLRKTLVLFFTA